MAITVITVNTTAFRLIKKRSTGEWVVRVIEGSKSNEDRAYYTDDFEDAIGTLKAMAREELEIILKKARSARIRGRK
jgi:molybdopterin biosynthesis enzyme MoaB